MYIIKIESHFKEKIITFVRIILKYRYKKHNANILLSFIRNNQKARGSRKSLKNIVVTSAKL
jgi:hypothetical protein